MNLEFLLIIFDYFKSISRREFLLEIAVPFLIGLFAFCMFDIPTIEKSFAAFSDKSVNLLGVLVGFSIAVITIFTTSSSNNIEEIKGKLTDIKIAGKVISIYDLLLLNLSYSVVVEIFILIFNLIYPLIPVVIHSDFGVKLAFATDIFIITHILFLTIRNITEFYFVLLKK